MGAWGIRNFENDSAGDWVVEFSYCNSLDFLEESILRVFDIEHDTEAELRALAAIEVVAILNSNPPPDLEEVDFNLLPAITKLEVSNLQNLKKISLKAINKILIESELKECWNDVGELTNWTQIITDLKSRIY